MKGDESEDGSVTNIITEDELEILDSFIIDTDIKETLKTIMAAKYTFSPSENKKLTDYITVFDNLEVTSQ